MELATSWDGKHGYIVPNVQTDGGGHTELTVIDLADGRIVSRPQPDPSEPTVSLIGLLAWRRLSRCTRLALLYPVMFFYTSAMALSIKSDEADRLARELARVTGESLTDAVTEALRERLERERERASGDIVRRLELLAADVARMPVLDDRPADEILGYDEHGLPT